MQQYPPNEQPAYPVYPQPPYPQLPTQPPRPPRKRRRWVLWTIVIVAILLIIGTINAIASGGNGVGNTANTNTPTTQPTQASHPTTTSTHAAQSTPAVPGATKFPATAGPARLGGDIGAFVANYGQPNAHTDVSSGMYHFQTYSGVNTDALIVQTDIFDTGLSSRVIGVSAQAPPGGWTVAQADQHCAVFYPTDATYKNQIATQGGYDKVYFSSQLVPIFPASEFVDAQQNPVKPGTFDVQYLYTDNTDTAIDSCSILLGEGQTS